MWVAVRQRFQKFHADLNPKQEEIDDAFGKAFRVGQALERAFNGQSSDNPPVFPVGSWGKGTQLLRSIHEGARDMARDIAATDAYVTSRRERKKVEMLFAHLKRILKLDRLRLRGPCGARDEFLLAATAQNLRKMAKLMPAGSPPLAA